MRFDLSIFEDRETPNATGKMTPNEGVRFFQDLGVGNPKDARPIELLQAVSDNHSAMAHLSPETRARINKTAKAAFAAITGKDFDAVASRYDPRQRYDEDTHDDMMPRSFEQILRDKKLGMDTAKSVLKPKG